MTFFTCFSNRGVYLNLHQDRLRNMRLYLNLHHDCFRNSRFHLTCITTSSKTHNFTSICITTASGTHNFISICITTASGKSDLCQYSSRRLPSSNACRGHNRTSLGSHSRNVLNPEPFLPQKDILPLATQVL
jgi:hypothetical protein